jgi:hypothetical protein
MDIESKVKYLYTEPDLLEGLAHLQKAELLVGHNITGFDIPALIKLLPGFSLQGEILDTMLLACILYPEEGTLSLEGWAKKLKLEQQKVEHTDWSTYSEAMGERCMADVVINKEVLDYLLKNPHVHMVKEALKLEQEVGLVHSQQVQNRVRFDLKAADELLGKILVELRVLRQEMVELGPKSVDILGTSRGKQAETKELREADLKHGVVPPYKEAFLKSNGQYNQYTKSYFHPDVLHTVKGPYTPVQCTEFNPDSSPEVQGLLLSLGWKPTEYNTVKDKNTGEIRTTSPKLTEDSFASLPPGLGQKIGRYNTLSHRRNWLWSEKNLESGAIPTAMNYDGDIPAEAFTCATPTARYRHGGIVCNIPRPDKVYGPEVRALFTVPPGYVMLGVDLKGIEARMLAHFLIAGGYKGGDHTAALILSGDFHEVNAKLWSVSREVAKQVLYALLYGAGAGKLAAIAGRTANAGRKMKDDFYAEHPAIQGLISDLEIAFKRNSGWITGIDGRPLYVRRSSTLLNTLLQNAATVVFKQWMVRLEEERSKVEHGADIAQIIAYHDELQFRVKDDPALVDRWKFCCQFIAGLIGRNMGIKVPIAADVKVGKNWRECH